MPLVVLFSLAAFQSSPHCFMMLCACTGPVDARPRAPANKRAESATLKDVLIIVNSSDYGRPAISPARSQPRRVAELIPPHVAVPLNRT